MRDVCIIGGGPAGSTTACFLKKYSPEMDVLVLEREAFPRDHIGESLLPPIGHILHEMGCWRKVEEAEFPIKIGATFRWGQSEKLWDFSLIGSDPYEDRPRPGVFRGQRTETAFQVDRSLFDKILLDHARELGAEVREETRVTDVDVEGDRVRSVTLESGEKVEAKYFLDCTGNVGLFRRKMGIEADEPVSLRNIAIWDYWQDADWAVTIGNGGTRILVLSVGFGWLWFIPITKTRTSIGLVVPADYYKECGLDKEELYLKAIEAAPEIRELVKKASREHKTTATKDWSHICQKLYGENWFMVGECAGFADPILSAGLTLAMSGAREIAFTLIELEKGDHDPQWLKESYEANQQKRIGQHIRFANFWYAGNGIFTDLQKYTTEIAGSAGLDLDPKAAFRWLATGGFTYDDPGTPAMGVFSLGAIKNFAAQFFAGEVEWKINELNEFRLNLHRAERINLPIYEKGRVLPIPCYRRDGKLLPMHGLFKVMVHALNRSEKASGIFRELRAIYGQDTVGIAQALEALEAMVHDGWVTGRLNKKEPSLKLTVKGSIKETDDLLTQVNPASA